VLTASEEHGVFEEHWAIALFSLTNELLEASRTADELLEAVLESGAARRIEIDAPQHFRAHPRAGAEEVAATRAVLDRHGATPTLLGVYAERWAAPGAPADPARARDALAAQLRTAAELGCGGARVALGTLDEADLRALLPQLEAAGLDLLLEVQGATPPDAPVVQEALGVLDRLDHDRLGILFDISVCTPRVPVSWRTALREAGVADEFGDRVEEAWGRVAPAELAGVVHAALAEFPPPAGTGPLVTACLSRFGASAVADWSDLLPRVRGVHLKFWDAEDADARISGPIHDLARALDRRGFAGDWTSEWGGHQWMSLPVGWQGMTAAHRAVAEPAIRAGAA